MLLCAPNVLSGVNTPVAYSDVAAVMDGYDCGYGRRPLFYHNENMRKATFFRMILTAYICHCKNVF